MVYTRDMAAEKFVLPFKKREEVVSGVHAFFFDRSLHSFNFKPGQYLKIRLPHDNPDEKGFSRDFSIACSPTHRSEIVIMTKDGPSSFKQMLMNLKAGQEVDFRAPFGSFVLPELAANPQILVTGGIGITPFISMVEYWVDEQLGFPLKLFASYSKPEEIILKDMFEKFARDNSQFEYIPTVTHPEGSSWTGQTGRIDKKLLEKYIPDLRNCTYYAVGPEAMTHAIHQLLIDSGIEDEHIRFEDFFGY
jgi:ferredoxin-NADP reductase